MARVRENERHTKKPTDKWLRFGKGVGHLCWCWSRRRHMLFIINDNTETEVGMGDWEHQNVLIPSPSMSSYVGYSATVRAHFARFIIIKRCAWSHAIHLHLHNIMRECVQRTHSTYAQKTEHSILIVRARAVERTQHTRKKERKIRWPPMAAQHLFNVKWDATQFSVCIQTTMPHSNDALGTAEPRVAVRIEFQWMPVASRSIENVAVSNCIRVVRVLTFNGMQMQPRIYWS